MVGPSGSDYLADPAFVAGYKLGRKANSEGKFAKAKDTTYKGSTAFVEGY